MKRAWIQRAALVAVGAAGYLLSPLSWWNDPYVNLPIAYLAANVANRVDSRLFTPAMLGTYWVTNLLGFLLMHIAARGLARPSRLALDRRQTLYWLAIAFVYSIVVALLCHFGILRPVSGY
jgi:hypothetical protein